MQKRWKLRSVTVREYKLILAGLARVQRNAERGMEENKNIPSIRKLWKQERNKARAMKGDLLKELDKCGPDDIMNVVSEAMCVGHTPTMHAQYLREKYPCVWEEVRQGG